MKIIQVLGPGCPKCRALVQNAEAALTEIGFDGRIEKVTDINEIVGFGVMTTPALAVDGEVKSVGKVLTIDQLKELLGSL
jgi:small redox-active disulfide protein 2